MEDDVTVQLCGLVWAVVIVMTILPKGDNVSDEVSTHSDDLSAWSKAFLPPQVLDISPHECNV